MPEWLKDWWPAIALGVSVVLIPFVRWVTGQIRKGLASHDDLQALRDAAAGDLAKHAQTAAAASAALEQRLGERIDAQSRWIAEHNVLHAQLAAQLDQMPKAGQLSEILLLMKGLETKLVGGLAEQDGELKALNARMEGVQATLDKLDERVMRHEGIFAGAGARVTA